MKECTYPPKTKQGHAKEPTAEYEVDTRADEDDIAPFLLYSLDDLKEEIYRRDDEWQRGEVRGYTMDEVRKMAAEWMKK